MCQEDHNKVLRMLDNTNALAITHDKVSIHMHACMHLVHLYRRFSIILSFVCVHLLSHTSPFPVPPPRQLSDQLDYASNRFSVVAEHFGQNMFREAPHVPESVVPETLPSEGVHNEDIGEPVMDYGMSAAYDDVWGR